MLNECWTEVGCEENRMYWDENGNYSFTKPPLVATECPYAIYPPSEGSGTYVYQSETNEIFVDLKGIPDSVNGNPTPKFISKKYFKIFEEKEDTVTVQTIYLGYEFDWQIDPAGKRKLVFLCEIDHLPFKTEIYKRSKNKK